MRQTNRFGVLQIWVAVVMATLAGPWAQAGNTDTTLGIERDATSLHTLNVENLLGSMTIGTSYHPGRLEIEARIVVDAKSPEAALLISKSVRLEEEENDGELTVRVVFGDGSIDRFRLPRSEKGNLLSKWVMPLIKKDVLWVDYGGHKVQVAGGREGLAVAVHLTVKLPLELKSSFTQSVGAIRLAAARGDVHLNVLQGRLEVDQFFGALAVEADAAPIRIRNFQGENLVVRAASGNVELSEIRSQRLDVKTLEGRVLGDSIKVGEARIFSENGNIALSAFDAAQMDVESQVGSVEIATWLENTEAGSIRSGSGNVTLRLGDTAWFDLEAETKSGEVSSREIELVAVGRDGLTSRYTRGNGGANLEIKATQGDVSVRPYDGSWLQSLMQTDE